MKKILKFIIIMFCSLFINSIVVQAAYSDTTLTTEYMDDVWSFHYRNGVLWSYGRLPFRYLNGNLAYCVEPDSLITTNVYNSYDDWGITPYTQDDKKKMELIAHYGYKYPGHDTIKYYMATQELIWLFSADDYIKWTTSNSSDGEEINIEREKNEILSLVNNHDKLPSFVSRCYTTKYGTKLKLNDDNNVLQNYDISSDLPYTINNSSVTFDINKFGSYTIELQSKANPIDNAKTIVYKTDNPKSQMMVTFGFNDIKKRSFSTYDTGVSIRINKKDKNTKKLIKNVGTVFKIKNLDTGEYRKKEYNVDENGYAIFTLAKGNYEIEEIKASAGYVINKENTKITIYENIKLNDSYYDIDIFNDVPKGKINILKVDDEDIPLKGVEIGIFDSKHKQIKKVITDDNGSASVDNLKLGTYYVKELNTIEGYVLNDEYHEVKLNYIDDKTDIVEENIKLVNSKIKCDVTYITTDESSKGVNGIEIDLYDESDNIIYNGKTDEEGKIIIENLPYGKYYIKQKSVPSGYILNDEIKEFSVSDTSCLSDIKVTNKKTIMPITSSSKENIFGLLLIMCLGGIFGIKKLI